jgi:dTDP-4-amino-4,6-dideoxygalactose transaminase
MMKSAMTLPFEGVLPVLTVAGNRRRILNADQAMINTPFSPWPSFTEDEASAVKTVLLSNAVNYWTGTECREFEAEFAAWTGAKYAVALSNGSVGLELALRAVGVGAGDEVIVTPRTFIASASCIVNTGAVPVFADVDRDSQNITAATIAEVISPRTKAIICVHLGGMPCDMQPIMELANAHSLYVIEDCAQAHGATYHGRMVGSIGHIGVWSFCQDKIITTGGEGGMVATDDYALWSFMWSYKDHGKAWDAMYRKTHAPGFRWVHDSFGTNWRMLEMQAVIGRIQLKHVDEWIATRRRNAMAITSAFKRSSAVRVPPNCSDIEHAYYKFYAFVESDQLIRGWDRDRIVREVVARGVPCYQGTCPEVYLESAFKGSRIGPAQRLPVAKELGETSLMFLVHPTLTLSEISKTCAVASEVFWIASGAEAEDTLPRTPVPPVRRHRHVLRT